MRKLLHIEMIVDASIGWDIMALADGKAVKLNVRTVKHGGEDENGKIQPTLTGQKFLSAFAQERKAWTVQEAMVEGKRLGLTTASIYAAASVLKKQGLIKSTGQARYALAAKGGDRRRNADGKTVTETIVDIVRGKQNGSGEGVHIKVIKGELAKVGFNASGTSPSINTLMKRKQIKRVAPSMYRVEV